MMFQMTTYWPKRGFSYWMAAFISLQRQFPAGSVPHLQALPFTSCLSHAAKTYCIDLNNENDISWKKNLPRNYNSAASPCESCYMNNAFHKKNTQDIKWIFKRGWLQCAAMSIPHPLETRFCLHFHWQGLIITWNQSNHIKIHILNALHTFQSLWAHKKEEYFTGKSTQDWKQFACD